MTEEAPTSHVRQLAESRQQSLSTRDDVRNATALFQQWEALRHRHGRDQVMAALNRVTQMQYDYKNMYTAESMLRREHKANHLFQHLRAHTPAFFDALVSISGKKVATTTREALEQALDAVPLLPQKKQRGRAAGA